MINRYRKWLCWSRLGRPVRFVSDVLHIPRREAQSLVLCYRDLWPEHFQQRPLTLAVWICSFAERYRVGARWLRDAVSTLDQQDYRALQRCDRPRAVCLMGQAAESGLPGSQAFSLAISLPDPENMEMPVTRAKPAA